MTHPLELHSQQLTRRELFQSSCMGLGGIALASMLADDGVAKSPAGDPVATRLPHFPAKAKNVIFLHMVGAPSHLDLFEFKPALRRLRWAAMS